MTVEMRVEVGGMPVHIRGCGVPGAPKVYCSMHPGSTGDLAGACRSAGCKDFDLVAITCEDWDGDLSPWPSGPVFRGGGSFRGGADGYAEALTDAIVPFAEGSLGTGPRVIAGYSMGGLFAIYAPYVTDAFDACVSASGSLWYPGFEGFVTGREPVRQPRAVYVSIGDRESRTRNPVLSTVEDVSRRISAHFASTGTETVFETNPGNHFRDADARLAKGISWALARIHGGGSE